MPQDNHKRKFLKPSILSRIVLAASALIPFRGDFSPRIISKPTLYPLNKKVIAAHRGGTERHPENSTEAFEDAGEHSEEIIELDVRKSADDFIVYHNSRIKGRAIKNLSYQNIKKLISYHVPTLNQALQIIKKHNKVVIIDIKEKGSETKILKSAKKILPQNKIIISSKNPESLRIIKETDLKIKTTLVVGNSISQIGNLIRTKLGIVPWKNIRYSSADYVSIDGKFLNPLFYRNAKKGNIGILVYGLERAKPIRAALQRPQVYGVITYNPSKAIEQRNKLKT